MIIPWNTDAPIYHFPYATIGLIVANTVAFGLTLAAEDPEPWMLAFGDGLHPVQWISSVFMHAGLGHLLGNMIFLWGFGLVIEGKLGWWRFLLVYLGLGIFESAVVQICMQHEPGLALGASGAIYGLLAMALIWAPRNDMQCISFFGLYPRMFDFPILGFVTLYVGLEILVVWLSDFEMSSSMLHLAGALPGFAVGTAMLKLRWVDCENWDVFAVLQGREGEEYVEKVDPRKEQEKQQEEKSRRENELAMARAEFTGHLAEGRAPEALALHKRMSQADTDWFLSQGEMLALIKALHARKLWAPSIDPIREYLRMVPGAVQVRLKLAQILIHCHRAARALEVLEKLPASGLPADWEKARRQLTQQARTMHDADDMDLEVDDGKPW
jgi:membrane associated rhomboid family serine protease